jgi:ubiquinone/menaquinone biosynthesis C-methylase UbiE
MTLRAWDATEGGSPWRRSIMSRRGLKWQVGVWDRISPIYLRAIDNRFTGVVDAVVRRAALQSVQQVLDLGAGTGSVAIKAATLVMPGGNVTAVDISPEMLDLARKRSTSLGNL